MFCAEAISGQRSVRVRFAAACSGFVYGVSIAQQFLESGRYKNALVIGAETLTKITNWKDRTSCILFGDGAGAVVLQQPKTGERYFVQHDVFRRQRLGITKLRGIRLKTSMIANRWMIRTRCIMAINGREVYQQAVRRIVETVDECLENCNLTKDDIAMVISHQMNARIIESAAKRLELPDEKVFVNIGEYGNTSSASVPIAFDECARKGRIKRGDIVIFVAFGAGLTWGANIIEF